jgi:membrane protein DedA with SNARE-associated domain
MLRAHLNYFFQHYGYWTVFFGIFLESTGVPLPGETILIVASVLAREGHQLKMLDVAAVASTAAIAGDNLGFAIGRYGGRILLERYRSLFHIEEETIRKGEALFARLGGRAVFAARFLAGLRVLAGPMAGALRMPWGRFLIFNVLGALSWVMAITTLAYFFGPSLEPILRHASGAIGAAVILAVLYWWIKRSRLRTRSLSRSASRGA